MAEIISLIIITYNRQDDLIDLLQSLKSQADISSLKEVLILNNASSTSYSKAEDFIQQHPALKIKYILSDENLGVSRGRNKLMAMAEGELLLVLDDDILFGNTNDFQKISTVFNKPFFTDANTGVITFKVIYYDTKEQQKTALPHKKFDEYKDKDAFLSSYFIGCCHLLKKEVLSETGFYPTDFFYGMEEYDLSYRIIKAGYSLGYDNIATFEHKESPQGRQPNYQVLASQWVNKTKVAYRYLPFIYYVTTMCSWSFQYIKKAGGLWGHFFKCWGKVLQIPFTEKRNFVEKKGMNYLKKVKARLWY